MIQIYHTIRKFAEEVNEKNISTFAAKAAYFIILSFIPFLILLMTLLQFTRFQQEDVMQLFHQTVPETIEPFINSIVSEIYEKSSTTVISISVVATMWTAGKGVTAQTIEHTALMFNGTSTSVTLPAANMSSTVSVSPPFWKLPDNSSFPWLPTLLL